VKGIILRHLRWWMKQPIFSSDGLLTIGYGYPNLIMAEGYNGPCSPYWAMKAFLPLAIPEEHAFWQAKEQPLPKLGNMVVQKHPNMIICRDNDQNHVYALTSGQDINLGIPHGAAKYAKFAYSNRFGFSVSKGKTTLGHGAFDSMLSFSEAGEANQSYRV